MLIESTWLQQCIIYTLLSYRSVTLSIVLEPEETTCTTRTNSGYVWRGITAPTLAADSITEQPKSPLSGGLA